MKKMLIAWLCIFFVSNAHAYLLKSTQQTEDKIKRYLVRKRALEDAGRCGSLQQEFADIHDHALHFRTRNRDVKALLATLAEFQHAGVQCMRRNLVYEAELVCDFCWKLIDCCYSMENRNTKNIDYAVSQAAACFGRLLTLDDVAPVVRNFLLNALQSPDRLNDICVRIALR